VPKDVHTIAIPPFTNATVKYKLTDLLPEAISREFITRTRYKTVDDPTQADAVLNGAVVRYVAYPTLINQATGRTSGLQIVVVLSVNLTERSTGKVIFARPNYETHERYELATPNPAASSSSQNAANYQYFDESGAGIQRLSKDVARDLVTSILENF
jgi:Lipopolysaccharide-assembly